MHTSKSFLFIFFLLTNLALFAQIQTEQSSYSTCKSNAEVQGNPFMVYISADWCMPCQLMEEGTFTEPTLSAKLADEIDFYKIDFDTEIGQLWSSEFAVACLPTTIYFGSAGEVLDRVESSYSSSECLELLFLHGFLEEEALSELTKEQSILQAQFVGSSSNREVQIKSSITTIEELLNTQTLGTAAQLELRKSLALLEDELQAPAVENHRESKQVGTPIAQFASHHSVVRAAVPYTQETSKERYIVQLGLFRSESNAMKLSSEVNSSTNLQTFIIMEERDGQKFHRVVSQDFVDRISANIAYADVKEAGYKAFVKTK